MAILQWLFHLFSEYYSFTKLIDKKLKRCPCTREKSLTDININVECGLKTQNNTKKFRIQYIVRLPKTQYFRRGTNRC